MRYLLLPYVTKSSMPVHAYHVCTNINGKDRSIQPAARRLAGTCVCTCVRSPGGAHTPSFTAVHHHQAAVVKRRCSRQQQQVQRNGIPDLPICRHLAAGEKG